MKTDFSTGRSTSVDKSIFTQFIVSTKVKTLQLQKTTGSTKYSSFSISPLSMATVVIPITNMHTPRIIVLNDMSFLLWNFICYLQLGNMIRYLFYTNNTNLRFFDYYLSPKNSHYKNRRRKKKVKSQKWFVL